MQTPVAACDGRCTDLGWCAMKLWSRQGSANSMDRTGPSLADTKQLSAGNADVLSVLSPDERAHEDWWTVTVWAEMAGRPSGLPPTRAR